LNLKKLDIKIILNMTNKMHSLHTPWTLWYHDIDEKEWTKDTYRRISDIYSLEDFWNLYNKIETFNKGMFFLMRKDIFPQWEDESNINGGYWSYKIPKRISNQAWIDLSSACIGELLMSDINEWDNINGISYSPKINNSVIKILNRYSTKNDKKYLSKVIDHLPPDDSQYKCHMDNKNEFVSN